MITNKKNKIQTFRTTIIKRNTYKETVAKQYSESENFIDKTS